MLKAGADPNARTWELGWSPLYRAIIGEDNAHTVETVQALLAGGAKADIPDTFGETPLENAVYQPNAYTVRVVEALLAGGADPARRRSTGCTVLHYAVLGDGNRYKVRIVEILLAAGADPSARCVTGAAPFDYVDKDGAFRGTAAYRRLEQGARLNPRR